MTSYGVAPPRFRLPDETAVGAVRLQVSQLQRSLTYYERVLGFVVHSRSDHTALLTSHDEGRPLVWLHERAGATPVLRGVSFGLYHFAILLPERAALGRFAAHLAALGLHAGSADHAVSESFYLTDPDGLGIEVYADRPRGTWRQRGRELFMTVDPLDVGSLIEAGSGEMWRGLPARSTMGHMHLHVGNLGEADAFYHAALGLDKIVWNFPGALFLSAGGYHHHLGLNTWVPGPAPAEGQARLLDWELVVPSGAHLSAAGDSLESAGYSVQRRSEDVVAADPWGTMLRIVAADALKA